MIKHTCVLLLPAQNSASGGLCSPSFPCSLLAVSWVLWLLTRAIFTQMSRLIARANALCMRDEEYKGASFHLFRRHRTAQDATYILQGGTKIKEHFFM